jgi:hypothetical protein
VARRANRRIVMRQVGDRLIPVGISSGRLHAISPAEAGAVLAAEGNAAGGPGEEVGGSRRRRRNNNGGSNDLSHLMGAMTMGGQDLEEASYYMLYKGQHSNVSVFSL